MFGMSAIVVRESRGNTRGAAFQRVRSLRGLSGRVDVVFVADISSLGSWIDAGWFGAICADYPPTTTSVFPSLRVRGSRKCRVSESDYAYLWTGIDELLISGPAQTSIRVNLD